MNSLDELYHSTLKKAAQGQHDFSQHEGDPDQLDCLLHPDRHALIWRTGSCDCPPDTQSCKNVCAFDAITSQPDQGIAIDDEKCVGCQACIDECKLGNLVASKDIMPVINELHTYTGPVYALIAPAFSGQFGEDVTPGKLRTALKKLGFAGMIEVAIFADILTLKEALEFDKNIHGEADFQLTSCCCPMWIAMIKKLYHTLLPNVPGAVSPMIAGGRTVKALYPDAKTVFIGPCLAKKAERREPDIADAIDYVLTFQELSDLLLATNLDVSGLAEDNRQHASGAGIMYAYAGGVSQAIQKTVEQLNPARDVPIVTRKAEGVPSCRALIEEILAGHRKGNFFEGMGCVGGCVGGPRAIVDKEAGKTHVTAYSSTARYAFPMENPYVIELLKRIGFETIEDFLEKSDIYNRSFE